MYSHVRALLASDQVGADKAVRAPVSPFLESTLMFGRHREARPLLEARPRPNEIGPDSMNVGIAACAGAEGLSVISQHE